MENETFLQELIKLINKHSLEGLSNTPDYVLRNYINRCLKNFEETMAERDRWYTGG